MRGVIIHAPKDLRIEDIPVVAPGPSEVRVRIAAGGICGSDLHYYHHGGFGTVRIKEPMALGHEIAGVVEEIGAERDASHPRHARRGQPEHALQACRYCREGLHHQCLDMHFIGSAMRFPHAQGGFRQSLTVERDPGGSDRRGNDDGRGRHGRAARRLPSRRPPGRTAAWAGACW